MEDIPIRDIITASSGVVTTTIVLSKIFFSRITKLETTFTITIDKLTSSLIEIDKRLAVNSTIIDTFLKGGCIHGRSTSKERNF